MSILSPDAVQFQSLVKKLSDGALSQALQMHADPSDPKGFWLAQEAMSRASARKEAQPQGGTPPTVAQQLAQQMNPQKPPMPPQGTPPMPQGVPGMGAAPPPGMPPQGMPPMPPPGMPPMPPPGMLPMPPPGMPPPGMPPQAPPQMQAGGHVHDYGIAGLPYEPHYEHGGIVSFAEGGDEELNKGQDEGLYEGQSFEGYNPDDPSQMLAELDTKGRSKEAQQQLEADTDAANVLTALRSIATGPALGLAGAADVGTMIPRGFGALAWERGEDGKLTRKMDTPDFNWFPATEAVKNWADAPIGDDFVSTRYDPNSDNAPLPKEEYKPTTSNVFSALNPKAAEPVKPFEAAPAPRRASPADLYNPSIPTIPAEEPPAPMPSNIREVTGMSGGIRMGGGGSGGSAPKTYEIDSKPIATPWSLAKEVERANQSKNFESLYGYDPTLNTKLLDEAKKEEEGLKRKRGKAAIHDLAVAMTSMGGQGSFLQGLNAFNQNLVKNFGETDKEMDALEASYKKHRQELQLGINGLARDNSQKAQDRVDKAKELMAADEAEIRKAKTERNKNVFDILHQDERSDRDNAAAWDRSQYSTDHAKGTGTDPILPFLLNAAGPEQILTARKQAEGSIDDAAVQSAIDAETKIRHDWKSRDPKLLGLIADKRQKMVDAETNRILQETDMANRGIRQSIVRSLLGGGQGLGSLNSGAGGSDIYSVIPR